MGMKAIFQLFVSDIGKAKRWYVEKLGAKVIKNYPVYRCAYISLGGTEIDMGEPIANWGLNWREAKKLVGKQIGILLEVKDVRKEYDRLRKKGVRFIVKPQKASWGETIADFKDLDGNRLRLIG
jgi:catechol 2,3-dioxygenase-like lactoylglutathione lyase family enzyme